MLCHRASFPSAHERPRAASSAAAGSRCGRRGTWDDSCVGLLVDLFQDAMNLRLQALHGGDCALQILETIPEGWALEVGVRENHESVSIVFGFGIHKSMVSERVKMKPPFRAEH